MTVAWHWVATPTALDEACHALAQHEVIGVDTEFLRETTFEPIPALIQIGHASGVWLIDPQAVAPTEALRALLGPEGPLKLLHACGEDLEIFAHWLGVLPTPMIDTQIAEGFCTGEASMGYQRLVAERLNLDIPKDATRSNWLARPLTEQQCLYAALDVAHLPTLWAQQEKALADAGKLAWTTAACQALLDQAAAPQDFSHYYLRNKQAWRLDARQLAALARLSAWRETEIRARNMPRGHLANDGQLFAIAERMPKNLYALADIQGLRPTFIKRDGEAVLAMIQDALSLPEADLPTPLPSPQSPAHRKRLKALKQALNDVAEAAGIAPELLARRMEREGWINSALAGVCPDMPDDWRRPVFEPVWAKVFDDLLPTSELAT